MCASPGNAAHNQEEKVKQTVDAAAGPVMEKFHIPGMAVGLTLHGKTYVLNYGVASSATGEPVTDRTLFEIGSVSKTFTATLASYAQVTGKVSLSDKTSKYLPELRGCKFGDVTLINLGTHTPGGLPLQFPSNVTNNDQLMKYFEEWQPSYAPGTHRTYSNPGVGMLGLVAAKSMKQDFDVLMETTLLPALGLSNTYINVPKSEMANYAQGYTDKDEPVRMTAGILSSEAYGIKTTAADLLRFVEANMEMIKLDGSCQRAITDTHTGYFQTGPMTQDLIWEQYPYPVELATLLAGNSPEMAFEAHPVTPISPPQKPLSDVWINKTGSTNGFATYVAFIPKKQMGLVILANKSYPNKDRVTLAHKVLEQLASDSPK